MDLALSVVLNRDTGSARGITRLFREQVIDLFVVYLEVTDFDRELLVVGRANLLEHLRYCPWNQTPIFEIWCGTVHGEGFSCSGLAVAHNGAVVASYCSFDDILSAVGEHVLLGGIMHYFVELEFPRFLDVVYETSRGVFRNVDRNILQRVRTRENGEIRVFRLTE